MEEGIVSRQRGPETARAISAWPKRIHSQRAGARADPDKQVQAWRAWSDCGDGAQIQLIIDPSARQVWLLRAGEPKTDPRSMQ
jgi:hypothetical protein